MANDHPKAQAHFTDPQSRIMHTPDGFQQCYNAQAAVDAESQVIVAQEVSPAPPDVQRLRPMLGAIIKENRRIPRELSADAGYASEANFQALDDAGIYAVISLRRYRRDEPPDADPAPARSSGRWPQRNLMREILAIQYGKAISQLRKQTVEPVFDQFMAARGFRQVLRHGLSAVEAWSLSADVLDAWQGLGRLTALHMGMSGGSSWSRSSRRLGSNAAFARSICAITS